MKTLITLSTIFAAGTLAVNAAAEELKVGKVDSSSTITDISSVSSYGYFWYLYESTNTTRPSGTGNVWAGVAKTADTTKDSDGSVYSILTNPNNTTYKLSNSTSSFEIGKAMYFDSFTNSNSSVIIDFKEEGSLTTTNQLNFGTGVQTGSIELKLDFTDVLLTEGRTILTGLGNYGIWNFSDAAFVSITLDGYTSVGAITGKEALKAGEVGYVYTSQGSGSYEKNTVMIFAKAIPEPSMFGLLAGLGALAIAGTRRRRR